MFYAVKIFIFNQGFLFFKDFCGVMKRGFSVIRVTIYVIKKEA